MRTYSVAQLLKWSVTKRELPPATGVRALHVYDFDNTLFRSALPNPQLWTGTTVGSLQNDSHFSTGGWWHDVHFLEATGEGVAVEEPRAWEGWWNENVVQLARLSLAEPGVLTVLLTGRAEHSHGSLIARMARAKGLDFDLVCLRPKLGPKNERFDSTMKFKQALLADLIYTFRDATELKIYEDRPHHVRMFREWVEKLNDSITKYPEHSREKTISAEVVQVPEDHVTLDPIVEVKEVQRMLNAHNAEASDPQTSYKQMTIRRQVYFTGYLLRPDDSLKLLSLIDYVGRPAAWEKEGEYKFFANNVLIDTKAATEKVLEKVGGMHKKQLWKAVAIGAYHEDKLYAARVAPVPESSAVYTFSTPPNVVLTCRKGTKTTDVNRIREDAWKPLPPDKQLVFETAVGEKVQLSIDEEGHANSGGGKWGNKRKHGGDNEADHREGVKSGPNHEDGGRKGSKGGRNFKDKGRGGAHGGGGARGDRDERRERRREERKERGRGGGGRPRGGYRSLDDVGDNSRYAVRAQGGRFDEPYDNGGYETAHPPAYGGAMDTGMDGSGGLQY